jgi:hypothetical protein
MIVFGLLINLTFLDSKKGHALPFIKLVYSSVTRVVVLARWFFFFPEITPSGTKSVFISWIIYPSSFILDL